MSTPDTLAWLTNGADTLVATTAALAFYFHRRAKGGWSARNKGQRASWGGEFTPADLTPGGSRMAAEREAQATIWNRLLIVSLGLAVMANLAGQ